MKYGLPMWGECYHISLDDKNLLCGNKAEIWVFTILEPRDYRACKNCSRKLREMKIAEQITEKARKAPEF